jgi:hypothetical protein
MQLSVGLSVVRSVLRVVGSYSARRLEDEARAAPTTSSHESKYVLSALGNPVVDEVALSIQARGRPGEA